MVYRTFLARAYPTMKKNNPNTPIMLREAADTPARVYARYGQSNSSSCASGSRDTALDYGCGLGSCIADSNANMIDCRIRKGEERVISRIVR
jgi:hypothetical protein